MEFLTGAHTASFGGTVKQQQSYIVVAVILLCKNIIRQKNKLFGCPPHLLARVERAGGLFLIKLFYFTVLF